MFSVVGRARALAHVELEVTHRLDGLIHGDFLGLAAGPGSEPADARRYEPGDDARRIDWNLSARMSELHTRVTEPDRELELWIVADRSASLDFGTAQCEKRDLVLAAAAAFGLRTIGHGNRVGMVIAGGKQLRRFPPRADRGTLMAALTALAQDERSDRAPGPGADLDGALAWVRRVPRRRGVVVVVSDFFDATAWPVTIRQLTRHHDVVAVQVVDPREFELPPVGLLSLVDNESGKVMHVQTGSPGLRERYRVAAADRHDSIRRALRGAGAALVVLSTDRDWVVDLARFLSDRRRGHALRTSGQRRSSLTGARSVPAVTR
ncbi:MAG: DUF58 domain-containing protein [Actinobacteria bacterium]|nr:DUF58 domain-containing protein [Actinomycetota bacterium]